MQCQKKERKKEGAPGQGGQTEVGGVKKRWAIRAGGEGGGGG
jgi:hypothetical protein